MPISKSKKYCFILSVCGAFLLFFVACTNDNDGVVDKVKLTLQADKLSDFDDEMTTRYDDINGWSANDAISVFVKKDGEWSGNLKFINKNTTPNAPASFEGPYEAKANDKLLIRAFAPYQSNFDIREGLVLNISNQDDYEAINFFKAEYRLDNYNKKPYLSFKRCMVRIIIDIYEDGARDEGYDYDKFRAKANIMSEAYVRVTSDFVVAVSYHTDVFFKEEIIDRGILDNIKRLSLLMFPNDVTPNILLYNTAINPLNPILQAMLPMGIEKLEAGKVYKFNLWKTGS